MAISQQDQDQQQEQNPCSIFDQLFCEEETLENDEETNQNNIIHLPFYEENDDDDDEKLKYLLNKEKEERVINDINMKEVEVGLINGRKEAVKWMVKVNVENGFSGLTSNLSVNYLDRFITSNKFINHGNKSWTFQLLAVASLSLAAKVEETHVPFLLDLQVEGGSPIIFEAKDVQKMELLVLSTLEWKMHPITPYSYFDHFIRRLGFNLNLDLHLEFLKKCELLLLSLLSDWRFVSYVPSVLAIATMMHVIDNIHIDEPSNSIHFQSHLPNLLLLNKEKVNECYELVGETLSSGSTDTNIPIFKRKFEQMMTNDWNPIIPSSPKGVMDTFYLSSDSSNDSWTATSDTTDGGGRLPLSSSVSSSPVVNQKKARTREQLMPLQLPSLSRVFAEVVESPR